MQANGKWASLGWRHQVWELVRFFCSLRGIKQRDEWIQELNSGHTLKVSESEHLRVGANVVQLLIEYLKERETALDRFFELLRTEKKALTYCRNSKVKAGTTKTKSKDHHQSSKALIASVNAIVTKTCSKFGLSVDTDPQTRCVWCNDRGLHVTARVLDGAIPSLVNPFLIWEIKEYWGKTSGGSKMSDAVYECHLVGRELRAYEEIANKKFIHVVFIDGRDQWQSRKPDLLRFYDLLNQGLIDALFVGKEVETKWKKFLNEACTNQ